MYPYMKSGDKELPTMIYSDASLENEQGVLAGTKFFIDNVVDALHSKKLTSLDVIYKDKSRSRATTFLSTSAPFCFPSKPSRAI